LPVYPFNISIPEIRLNSNKFILQKNYEAAFDKKPFEFKG